MLVLVAAAIVISLIVQGFTLEPLARLAGFGQAAAGPPREETLARVRLAEAGLARLDELADNGLERRSEIGLRPALGATRGQIRAQFLSEAMLLALLGGAAGMAAGALATGIYATIKGWAVVIPPLAWAGGLGAALAIGAIAGLLPAIRAAHMSPTEALRTA